MTNLALAKTSTFEGNQTDVYTDGITYFMTINQLALCLGYASKTSLDSLLSRNKYLNDDEFSTTCNLQVVEGDRQVTRKMRVFSEDGIYEVAFLSKTAVAQMFRAWVRKILKELRKQAQQPQSPQPQPTTPFTDLTIFQKQTYTNMHLNRLLDEHTATIERLETEIEKLNKGIKIDQKTKATLNNLENKVKTLSAIQSQPLKAKRILVAEYVREHYNHYPVGSDEYQYFISAIDNICGKFGLGSGHISLKDIRKMVFNVNDFKDERNRVWQTIREEAYKKFIACYDNGVLEN